MASPPLLVVLGLTLPDSRILSGIASIGLTLANIAIILPHLRQPICDSIHALESALPHEQSPQEQIKSSLNGSNTAQPVDLDAESPVPASLSISEKEYRYPPLTFSTTIKSASTLNAESEVAPRAILLSPAEKTCDDQISPQTIPPSFDADVSDRHVGLFTREGRGAPYIPLPVPDEAEITFFDTKDSTPSNSDPGEDCALPTCEQHSVPEEGSIVEDYELAAEKDVERNGHFIVVNVPTTQERKDIGRDPTDVTMLVADEKLTPSMNAAVRDRHSPVMERNISDLRDAFPVRGGTAPERRSSGGGKEVLTKCRPESLEFIPQSVIRRHPSAPVVSARHGFEHQAFGLRHDHQVSPAPLHVFIQNPTLLLEGAKPRASYTTLEAHWCAPFLTEVHPTRQTTEVQSLITGKATTPDPETTAHELNPLGNCRMGVLARAALHDYRPSAHSHGNCGSSVSDSDSDSDNDSQHSSRSSAYEGMIPHMLGAALIAAIDANSESDLHLANTKWRMPAPLNVYEDFLVSEESAADVSMTMQVSSHDGPSDGEVRGPATLRSLTREDIRQWASEVVQKCVRKVYRNRVPAESSSPSQASDICAERPSGSGISQCPLSGLHRKPGAAALAEVSVLRTKELPVSLPPTSIPPSRKPLQVRNLRDIPEFVPRQRRVSPIVGRVERHQRLGTRSSIEVARAAATRVIARMETQARFNARQWPAGTVE